MNKNKLRRMSAIIQVLNDNLGAAKKNRIYKIES